MVQPSLLYIAIYAFNSLLLSSTCLESVADAFVDNLVASLSSAQRIPGGAVPPRRYHLCRRKFDDRFYECGPRRLAKATSALVTRRRVAGTTLSTSEASTTTTALSGYMDDIDTSPVGARERVFTVNEPHDLLEFLGRDDRLCVVKVWAKWCRTCKVFDLRWRRLVHDESDNLDAGGNIVGEPGRARFGEIEYTKNEELCRGLNATLLPHVLFYRRMRKRDQFKCVPAEFPMLLERFDRYAEEASSTERHLEEPVPSFEEFVLGQQQAAGLPATQTLSDSIQTPPPEVVPRDVNLEVREAGVTQEGLEDLVRRLRTDLDATNAELVEVRGQVLELRGDLAATSRHLGGEQQRLLDEMKSEMEEKTAGVRADLISEIEEAVRQVASWGAEDGEKDLSLRLQNETTRVVEATDLRLEALREELRSEMDQFLAEVDERLMVATKEEAAAGEVTLLRMEELPASKAATEGGGEGYGGSEGQRGEGFVADQGRKRGSWRKMATKPFRMAKSLLLRMFGRA